jgi:flagella basal body P-ring formation protein FlgA
MDERIKLVALLLVATAANVFASTTVTPQEAIAAAVRERVGVSASIVVADLATKVTGEAGLRAQPEPVARLGQPARFVLSVNGVRRGLAVATVKVTARYPRASRNIARDEAIDAGAVRSSDETLAGVTIRALLRADAVAGLRARRDIVSGEPLTENVLRVPPLVKSGDSVDATVRIGAVSVTATGIASGSGQIGDVIRVMQPHSSRLLNARIVGPGAVEIVE